MSKRFRTTALMALIAGSALLGGCVYEPGPYAYGPRYSYYQPYGSGYAPYGYGPTLQFSFRDHDHGWDRDWHRHW